MPYSNDLLEEELKNKVAIDFFSKYDYTRIIGKIDFCIKSKDNIQSFLWAEAKRGNSYDIYKSFVQLILTIGKAKTFEQQIPPYFIGAFDAEKIAFIEYNSILDIFYKNDFNWNITPSNHETKEFKYIYELVIKTIEENLMVFKFGTDDTKLYKFISNNFVVGNYFTGIEVTKNNFMFVYHDWCRTVKDTIHIKWEIAKKFGLIDADFFLADLLSQDNATLKDKLYVLLKSDHYEFDRTVDEIMAISVKSAGFTDNQVAHKQFWNIYHRPPREEYWNYIVERRDLLVPQDIRERKGSFFTPQKWVRLSQQYIADVLGEDWQDEYYIWDCCAGTGNLLNGLTNKYNIWASTIDIADVEIIKDRIKNGANLLESHVFQFDFLNDSFDKCPQGLQDIINNPEKKKKLVIYINPPYAEATNTRSITSDKNKHKKGVSQKGSGNSYNLFLSILGRGINEVFVQFLLRIYKELSSCRIAHFSTLKIVQSYNFRPFRDVFLAKLERLFVVPANTFDNVKGKFPIGFFIWDTNIKLKFNGITADVYNYDGNLVQTKEIYEAPDKLIMQWLQQFYDKKSEQIAYLVRGASDMQNNRIVFITQHPSKQVIKHSQTNSITKNNLMENCIYYAVRHVIDHTWINDRDQYLFPNDAWKNDAIFATDCLTYSLFTNNIKSSNTTQNHWIPFTESEVDAQEKFTSHFMTDYISGKLIHKSINEQDSFIKQKSSIPTEPLEFSSSALSVFDAGRELWRYYHTMSDVNINASLYDIKEYFQGRNDKGKMNIKSKDEKYNKFISNLRNKLKILASKIEPKVYEYGFLK